MSYPILGFSLEQIVEECRVQYAECKESESFWRSGTLLAFASIIGTLLFVPALAQEHTRFNQALFNVVILFFVCAYFNLRLTMTKKFSLSLAVKVSEFTLKEQGYREFKFLSKCLSAKYQDNYWASILILPFAFTSLVFSPNPLFSEISDFGILILPILAVVAGSAWLHCARLNSDLTLYSLINIALKELLNENESSKTHYLSSINYRTSEVEKYHSKANSIKYSRRLVNACVKVSIAQFRSTFTGVIWTLRNRLRHWIKKVRSRDNPQ